MEIPPGKFLSGTIHMKSHVRLNLQKGATLLGSAKRHDYDHSVWYALIEATKAEDFAITGEGTIDGQGAELARDVLHMVETGEIKIPPKGWRPSEVERPQIIEFTDCRRVRVEDVSILNSCCWVQTYRNCVGLLIQGIKVDSKTYWNNDGIDLLDCRDVMVENCDVDCGDDGICLKSDRPDAFCENIAVKNCRIRSSASAIKFGTSSHGGFRNILVDHIDIHDTFRSAVALESVDGGTLEDVTVSNIRARHTGNAFFVRLGHRNTKVAPGIVRRVHLKNFDVEVPAGRPDFGYPFKGPQFLEPHNLEPSSIVGHTERPIEDVTLENITIRTAGGGLPSVAYFATDHLAYVPERATDYPEFTMFGELPAWALYVRHVKGLRIENFHALLGQRDYRPAFVASDVTDMRGRRISVDGPGAKNQFLLHKCTRVSLPKNVVTRRVN